jgi:hypothetical protein
MSTRSPDALYEEDFFAWTQLQARELRRFARTRPNVPLDLQHLAEEIADLGKEHRNAVRSWTIRILEHLLLLEHSPAREARRGWQREVRSFCDQIDLRLTPRLRHDLARQLPRLYARALHNVAADMEAYGEAETAAALPGDCPYDLDRVLGDWWPGEPRSAA